ncbi:Hypothetical Protein FCC1311_110942 [Hondaea fermentalgiana]|uniref:Uncharacterized protein n=1 Tax=Hondaea fermentalgiana TaxID=2315210 RepID=A0A2R5H211_9STRA|nr:Hypothetical Protein FCC1311_110942 [Hondaea fermentalgiana]|eukprot:GBG34871.1 Hypothetical Protein FCC1311_110942 [Hondaea fermentalgiana]
MAGPMGLVLLALVLASAPTQIFAESSALDAQFSPGDDLADEVEKEIRRFAREAAERADTEAREKPIFKDRSTPPLWQANSTVSTFAEIQDAPTKLAVEAKSGRVFFAPHAFSAPDREQGQGFLSEWVESKQQAIAFPSEEFQDEIRQGIAALAMDNIRGWLLVLDANPYIYAGPSVLFVVEVASGNVLHRFELDEQLVGEITPTNMVICPRSQFVFIANNGAHSGVPSLLVIDIHVWKVRKLLEDHEAVQQRDVLPILNNREPIEYPWRFGLTSLAIDARNKRLILGSMFGDLLYSIPLRTLQAATRSLPEDELWAQVQILGPKTVSDAIDVDPATGNIYVTDFEHSALSLIEPAQGWSVMTLVQSEDLLRWPSDLVIVNGHAYVACSALDKIMEGDHKIRAGPFHILRMPLYKEAPVPVHDEL